MPDRVELSGRWMKLDHHDCGDLDLYTPNDRSIPPSDDRQSSGWCRHDRRILTLSFVFDQLLQSVWWSPKEYLWQGYVPIKVDVKAETYTIHDTSLHGKVLLPLVTHGAISIGDPISVHIVFTLPTIPLSMSVRHEKGGTRLTFSYRQRLRTKPSAPRYPD